MLLSLSDNSNDAMKAKAMVSQGESGRTSLDHTTSNIFWKPTHETLRGGGPPR